MNGDAEAARCQREDVEEDDVDDLGRTQEGASLGAAARDEEDGSRRCRKGTYAAAASRVRSESRTDTSFETPGSSIVTP